MEALPGLYPYLRASSARTLSGALSPGFRAPLLFLVVIPDAMKGAWFPKRPSNLGQGEKIRWSSLG